MCCGEFGDEFVCCGLLRYVLDLIIITVPVATDILIAERVRVLESRRFGLTRVVPASGCELSFSLFLLPLRGNEVACEGLRSVGDLFLHMT